MPVNTATITIQGKSAPPEDVTNFTGTWEVNLRSVKLEWTAVTDIDLYYYEIRDDSSSLGWDDATYITTTDNTEVDILLDDVTDNKIYLIKAVDTSGNYSDNAISTESIAVDTDLSPTYGAEFGTNITGGGTGSNEVSNDGTITIIGGLTTDTTSLAVGTNIIIDADTKSISINDATFGNQGIQLQYNGGTPRAYIGNGLTTTSGRFFNFDGTDLSWQGANTSLTTGGVFTATDANITGAITATSGSFSGAITATTIDIGGDDETSFHVDINGNLWSGAATYNIETNPFAVSSTGVLHSESGDIGAWTISSTKLSAGTDADYIGLEPSVGIQMGDSTFADAPFSVTKAGVLKATEATITGSITANSGTIGSFTIGTYLYTGSKTAYDDTNAGVHLGSDGIGFGNNIFTVSASGDLVAKSATIGNWSVNTTSIFTGTEDHSEYTANAGDITIYSDGSDASIHANNFYIDSDGDISAKGGNIGGWTLATSTLTGTNIVLDSDNDKIIVDEITIDGANNRIKSDNYVSGINGSGFYLDPDLLEVGNISARGILRTAVFQTDAVSAVGGNLAVLSADILANDITALDSDIISRLAESGDTRITEDSNIRILSGVGSIVTIEGNETFAVGDILRIKDGINDEWMRVNAIDGDNYIVIRDLAGVYDSDLNPTWARGASVINYKQSGDGGIFMTSSESNAPYLEVFTHEGTPWNPQQTDIKLRLGNLNGYLGYTSDLYGIAIGETDKYLKYDPTNGLRIKGDITVTGGNAFSKDDDTLDDIDNGTTYGKAQIGVLDGGYLYLLRKSAGNTERLEITAGGMEGYSNNVKNFELASGAAYLGDQSNEHIKISSAGMQVYDGATQLASYGSDILIGQTGSGQSNVYINSGSVSLRNNTTGVITLDSSGDITLNGTLTGGILESTNWATDAGMQIDLDNATFTIREAEGFVVDSDGGVSVKAGADISLEGSGTNPGSVIFNSDNQSVLFGMEGTNDILSILPDAKGKVSLNIGNTQSWGSVSDPNFKAIDLVSGPDGTTYTDSHIRLTYNDTAANGIQNFLFIDKNTISLESSYASVTFPYSNSLKISKDKLSFTYIDSLANLSSELVNFKRNSLFNYEINLNVNTLINSTSTFSDVANFQLTDSSTSAPVDGIVLENLYTTSTGGYYSPSILFKNSSQYVSSNQVKIAGVLGRLIGNSTVDDWSTSDFVFSISKDTALFYGSLKTDGGVLQLSETTEPSDLTNYGQIYTKSDNLLYFKDGAGTEYTIDITAV